MTNGDRLKTAAHLSDETETEHNGSPLFDTIQMQSARSVLHRRHGRIGHKAPGSNGIVHASTHSRQKKRRPCQELV